MCRDQASQLATLKPQLDQLGVGMHAVVHETGDVDGFRPFYPGEVYFDMRGGFYEAQGDRRLGYHAVLRPSVIRSINNARKKGIEGNLTGEGRRLGGVLIINNSEVVFEHREEVRGAGFLLIARLHACLCMLWTVSVLDIFEDGERLLLTMPTTRRILLERDAERMFCFACCRAR
jgi:hypothetical protein